MTFKNTSMKESNSESEKVFEMEWRGKNKHFHSMNIWFLLAGRILVVS